MAGKKGMSRSDLVDKLHDPKRVQGPTRTKAKILGAHQASKARQDAKSNKADMDAVKKMPKGKARDVKIDSARELRSLRRNNRYGSPRGIVGVTYDSPSKPDKSSPSPVQKSKKVVRRASVSKEKASPFTSGGGSIYN